MLVGVGGAAGPCVSTRGQGCGHRVRGFQARDVVRDEVDEVAGGAGKDFLEGFQDQRVDEEVVDGGEVGAQRHVVDVAVGFGGAQGGVDELFVAGGEGGA